ncbi:MAG: DUF4842 domain-containing protein [Bacteroidaceae bacterium]
MKVKHLFFVLFAAVSLGSCSNDDSLTEGNTPPIGGGLATSKALSYASIYADANCKTPIIENTPLTSATTQVDFALSYGLNDVYVKYPTAKGYKVMQVAVTSENAAKKMKGTEIENSEVYEATHAVSATIVLPEDAVKEYVTNSDGYTNYHSSGVVMFDDSWPYNVAGIDNDFNDLVVDYDLEATTIDEADTLNTWREDLKVVMHVRAKGGGFAAGFGLLLEDFEDTFIDKDDIDIRVSQGNWGAVTKDGITAKVEWNENSNGGRSPIIYINDLYKLINPKSAKENGLTLGTKHHFYNVENDESLNVTKGLFTVTVTFRAKDRKNLSLEEGKKQLAAYQKVVMDTQKQNFFLVTKQKEKNPTNNKEEMMTYEVHMKNYAPTASYEAKYEADRSKGIAKDPTNSYCAIDGFVWGFKVPVLTRHAVEKANFHTAYPQYAEWVTSNGSKNADWYKSPNQELTEKPILFNGKMRKVLKYISEEW